MNVAQRLRARLVLIGIFVVAVALASSLYWTQILKGKTYATQANKQYSRPLADLFDRGSIFFRAKDGTRAAAATISSGYLLYMNPQLITKSADAYQALSQVITIDKTEFMKKASRTTDPYEELMHKISDEKGQAIAALRIPGISVVKESWRSYPGNRLGSHLLGIIGENSSQEIEGRYGLERSYQSVLGRTGTADANPFAQFFAGFKDILGGAEGQPGDLVTTVEPTVAGYLEKILRQTSAQWQPDEIGGIIIDPQTGDILAMAALPDFDPNNLSSVKNAHVFSNALVENVYEMGSIMKPLTMAAGLDSGAFKPSSTYDDTGTLTLNGKTISNYDGKARGIIPMQEVLSQSLNIGAATIALKVGKEKFESYFKAFGLGEKTGIDQPNEATGLLGNLARGQDIEVATAAYGQGIAVSPIAMARSLAVLANGGYVIKPALVRQIDYLDGTSNKIKSEKRGPVISKTTADEVTNMLVKVVDTKLRDGALKMEHWSIAAKTGTAQVPNPVSKDYYKDRYLHSFFGYFPAYNPRFLVFLYQRYPKGAQYASETLADPFGEIAKFLIDYYDIPPDR